MRDLIEEAVDAADEQEVSPGADEQEVSPGQDESEPEPQKTQHELELERRLTQQGREAADLRKANTALAGELSSLKTTVTQIAANQSADAQRESERREREREAYLATLPPADRAIAEIKLLRGELDTLKKTRTDAPPARTASQQDEPDPEYTTRRAREIISRAQTRYGVTIDQTDMGNLPEDAWNSEDDFALAIADLARGKSGTTGESTVPKPKKDETPEEMETRIMHKVRQDLGVGSPASPRASGKPGKKPTESDVQAAVGAYDSRQGPRANVARLKAMREKMAG